MTLQRLVLDFRTGNLVVRCLYRTKAEANPGTKARRRECPNREVGRVLAIVLTYSRCPRFQICSF